MVTSRFISIIWVSIKIKVTHYQPVNSIRHVDVLKPLQKSPLSRSSTGCIYVCENPRFITMIRDKFHRHTILILKYFRAKKQIRLLDDDWATRSSNRWNEFRVKRRTNLLNKHKIKSLFFCLLKTNYITIAVYYTISDNIPFLIRVYSSNIPTKDRPRSNWHWLNKRQKIEDHMQLGTRICSSILGAMARGRASLV